MTLILLVELVIDDGALLPQKRPREIETPSFGKISTWPSLQEDPPGMIKNVEENVSRATFLVSGSSIVHSQSVLAG